ncbi:MAG TPA: hypothetical protein VND40_06040 [Nitrososphaerales archaeon]|nr:hypothetical protein [Nitrososphaerales archaeon]
MTPSSHGYSEEGLREAAVKASRTLDPSPLAVRCRTPLVDGDCPEVADVDLVAIWERKEELPERRTVDGPTGRAFVDVLWIPASALLDPFEAAGYMMLPHLLWESEPVSTRSEAIGAMVENIRLNMHERSAWEKRIGEQINFGDAALKEATRNLDFPPAAVFFLQTAHAYYLTALADCLKQSVMSLLTRPMAKVRRMSAETGLELERMVSANLRLEADPSRSLEALGRVHAAVSGRGSPRQVQGLGERTRGHYLYSISPLELEYREAVAGALVGKGDYANANFYLRFWAYSLSRCPVVLEEARQGRETSFYVPFRPFEDSVQAACPEILDDMSTIFGRELTAAEAGECVEGTEAFRGLATRLIRERGLHLTSSRDATRP